MLSKLRTVEVVTGRRLSAHDVRDYGAHRDRRDRFLWSGEGVQSSTHEPIEGAAASLPTCSCPSR